MEINTQKIFSPWRPEETERVVVSNLAEAKDADRYVQRMKKLLPTGQFKAGCFLDLKVRQYTKKELEDYAALLQKVELTIFRIALVSGMILFGCTYYFGRENHQTILYIASLAVLLIGHFFLKRNSDFFYPELIFKGADTPTPESFNLVVYRCPTMARKLPPNFNIKEDVDIFTRELFTEEMLHSPKTIYLPHAVVDSKGFIKSVLEKGALTNPLGGGYDQQEYGEIVKQISQIFKITPADFDSCFEDFIARQENGVEERGLDPHGKYTAEARAAIAYALDGIIDSALPEIDEFFDQLEGKLIPAARTIAQSPVFQSYLSLPWGSVNLSTFSLSLQFMNLPLHMGMRLRGSAELGDTIIPVFSPPFLFGVFFKNHGLNKDRAAAGAYLENLKKELKRAIRLHILSLTPFNLDMRKRDRAEARVKRFEALTGVSLSESEDGSQG